MAGSENDKGVEDFKDAVWGQMGIRTGTTTNEIFLNMEEDRKRSERERSRMMRGGGGGGASSSGPAVLVLAASVAAGVVTGSWFVGIGAAIGGGLLVAAASSFVVVNVALRMIAAFAIYVGFFGALAYAFFWRHGQYVDALVVMALPVGAIATLVLLGLAKDWFVRTRLWAFIVLAVSWIVAIAIVGLVATVACATIAGML